DPAGEISGHSGIPLCALCRPGDPGPALSSGGTAAAAHARIHPRPPTTRSRADARSGDREQGRRIVSAALLACRGLTCRFGGVVALDRVDFEVSEGEIVGLIGPNGSGKTTLFNVVTGIYGADEGNVTFSGADISAATRQAIYRAGITRTFQRSRMCLPLS